MIIAPSTATLRAERLMLVARYDCYSFSPAIFVVLKEIETQISWLEHCDWARRAVAPSLRTAGKQREGVTYRAG
jgi:hypothetical protein